MEIKPLLDLIQAGGWLMAPILACSLAAATIIIERLWALRRARVLPNRLLAILDHWLESGAVHPHDMDALPLNSPLGRIVAAGLACRGRSRDMLRERVEDVGRHVVHELERFLSTLGTIAAISPLLGLLGTVTGMIKCFRWSLRRATAISACCRWHCRGASDHRRRADCGNSQLAVLPLFPAPNR
jgi:biopolymer transport protein ExbB